jgi:hypothetical protein
VTRSGIRRATLAVWSFSAAYAAFIAWTFLQALAGHPFL